MSDVVAVAVAALVVVLGVLWCAHTVGGSVGRLGEDMAAVRYHVERLRAEGQGEDFEGRLRSAEAKAAQALEIAEALSKQARGDRRRVDRLEHWASQYWTQTPGGGQR